MRFGTLALAVAVAAVTVSTGCRRTNVDLLGLHPN
jgi:hypothetical protein